MVYFNKGLLIFEEADLQAFMEGLEHPNPDTIRKRDAFFSKLDQMGLTMNEDGSSSFEFSID